MITRPVPAADSEAKVPDPKPNLDEKEEKKVPQEPMAKEPELFKKSATLIKVEIKNRTWLFSQNSWIVQRIRDRGLRLPARRGGGQQLRSQVQVQTACHAFHVRLSLSIPLYRTYLVFMLQKERAFEDWGKFEVRLRTKELNRQPAAASNVPPPTVNVVPTGSYESNLEEYIWNPEPQTGGTAPAGSGLISCPECTLDNPASAYVCQVCGHSLRYAAGTAGNDNTAGANSRTETTNKMRR